MKLRIHAGSLRLRLSRSEIAGLAQTGRVEDSIGFAPGQSLAYALEIGQGDSIQASFSGNRLTVVVPAVAALSWIESDQPGLEGGTTGAIMVEKDFQCLHRGDAEDADAFPNPLVGKT